MLLSIKKCFQKYNNGTEALKNVSFDVEKENLYRLLDRLVRENRHCLEALIK